MNSSPEKTLRCLEEQEMTSDSQIMRKRLGKVSHGVIEMDKKWIWYSEKNAGLLRRDLHNPIKKFIEAGFCFLVAA